MKKILTTLLISLVAYCSVAQSDTLYVKYQGIEPNFCTYYDKMEIDPDPRTHFPFNGGASYHFPKKAGKFKNELRFHFLSYALDGPWSNFDFLLLEKEELDQIEFIDRKWFNQTNYHEIIRIFSEREIVILLLDEQKINTDSAYLVRVLFTHTAIE